MEQIRNLKDGFQELTLKLWPILAAASARGIPIDKEERDNLIIYLENDRTRIYKEIQSKVPDEIRKIHPVNGYVRTPQEVQELTDIYNRRIGTIQAQGKRIKTIDEFIADKTYLAIIKAGEETKIWGKMRYATFSIIDKELNEISVGRWCRVDDFNPNSSKQIIKYIKFRKHKVPVKLTGEETSDAKELERLAISTKDIFYDQIIEYRQINKMLTNDIPNWSPNEQTGAVHTTFGFYSATGQLTSRSPNVQNANKHKPLGKRFRRIVRARSGGDRSDGRGADGRRRLLVEVDYCVSSDTLILTDFFEWKKAGELTKEDILIGFDENLEIGDKHRYLRESKIEEIKRLRKPCYRIVTDLGEVICSKDHRWLSRGRNAGTLYWHEANDLIAGDHISFFTKPWEQDDNYEASYLAGFMDGEGYVSKTHGVGFGQNPGEVLNYVKDNIEKLGFDVLYEGTGIGGCEKYSISGGPFYGMRFIGTVRPIRLLDNLRNRYEGTSVRGKLTRQAEILSIEDIGEQEVIGIQSSTRTFIANGFLSHNSGFHAIMLGREAQSERYINISRIDAHSWFTSHIVGKPVEYPRDFTINAESRERFISKLKTIKQEYKIIRDTQAKPTILGVGLGLGPKKMYWTNRERYDKKLKQMVGIKDESQSKKLQGIIKELLPELFIYQERIKEVAFRQTYLINRWGMIRWFFDVRGEDGEAAIAFNVQGNSHGMLRWVIRRLEDNVLFEGTLEESDIKPIYISDDLIPDYPRDRYISANEKFHFINTIHDSLLPEPWEDELALCIQVYQNVMETPCLVLADKKVCPDGLVVRTEATYGENWCEYDEKTNPNGMRVWKN